MLIICNDLSTLNSDVKKAVEAKNSETIAKIANEAKEAGFDSLELYAGNTENEAENLLFLINATEDLGLKLILHAKDSSIYKEVLPKVNRAGIIAPIQLTNQEAKNVFSLLNELDAGWEILFTQSFGNETIHSEVEGMKGLISKAEQYGVMPELIYIDPVLSPLLETNYPLTKMRRMIDAFENSYPDMNFYVNLPFTAEGLRDDVTLMNVFIGMASLSGISAYSFDLNHKEHIEAIKASNMLLNNKNIKDVVAK